MTRDYPGKTEFEQEAKLPSAQEQHDAIWTPILAAHRVAAALRTIADALPHLSPEAQDVANSRMLPANVDWYRDTANRIEAAAPLPITPTEDDYEDQYQRFYDAQSDAHPKDTTHAWLDTMTEADKAEEIAQAALDEMLDSDNDYDNGTHSNEAWGGPHE